MTELLLTNAAVVAGLMFAVWLLSLPRRDVSIVDIAWGLGFVLVAWTTAWRAASATTLSATLERPSTWLLPVCTTLWGLRLSGYLAWRNHGRGEDKRYAAMRARRPETFWRQSLVSVFALQGAVMWFVSLPLQAGIARAGAGWSPLHLLGVAGWGVGLWFETVGDWQLARFRQQPDSAGRVLQTGLWRYTRHPNYFGDFCVWWGLYLIAAAQGAAWWTVGSPLAMSYFLLRVSGVPLLEASLRADKPEYADYIRRTSAFFPRPPRP